MEYRHWTFRQMFPGLRSVSGLHDLLCPAFPQLDSSQHVPWFLRQFSLYHIQIPAASSLFCWPYAFKHRAVYCSWQAGRLQGHPAGATQRRNTGKVREEGGRDVSALWLGGSVTNTTKVEPDPQCLWALLMMGEVCKLSTQVLCNVYLRYCGHS